MAHLMLFEVIMRKLITVSELANRGARRGLVPYSVSSIWRLAAAGKFPAPMKLTSGRTVWDLAQVESWMEAQIGAAK